MRVIVLNLKRSDDRRRNMARELSRFDGPYEFLDAVDGRSDPSPLFRYVDQAAARRFMGREMAPGEMGCFASHFLAWQDVARQRRPAIVLEDDVSLSERFPDAMRHLDDLIEAFGYIRLFGLRQRPYDAVKTLGADWTLVRYRQGPLGGQAYALGPATAERLIAKARKWVIPVDDFLDRFWSHGVPCLALHPFCVALAPSHFVSSIDAASDAGRAARKGHRSFVARKLVGPSEALRRQVSNLLYDLSGTLTK